MVLFLKAYYQTVFMKFNLTKSGLFLMLLSSILFLNQCKKESSLKESNTSGNANSNDVPPKVDSVAKKDSVIAEIPNKESIKFSPFIFPEGKKKKDSAMAVFNDKYSVEERYTILALNRLDSKNKWRADTLVVPEKIERDFLKYSPYPFHVDALRDVKKIAFFDYAIHAYALYENGNLIKWGPSSMGKKATPTKKGLMFTNWKKEVAISTSNSEWKLRWNFNIHNTMGIGWHQYDLPGFHASHSCLRLLEEDAKWMYNWADQWVLTNKGASVKAKGTPVIVFGETDFKSKPWYKLLSDSKANDISVDEITNLVTPHLDEIMKEQKNSEQLRSTIKTNKETEKEAA